jgi:cathepsin L
MKTIALLALLIVASYAIELRDVEFQNWRRTHMKEYSNQNEYSLRLRIFSENIALIEAHNSKREADDIVLGMNQFGDLTHEEFARTYLAAKGSYPTVGARKHEMMMGDLPTSVDWREKNAVTPVKDQGQCGSCWAFSSTGTLEGIHAIASGDLVSLSEKQLMDCSWSYENEGCNGGYMPFALQYAVDRGTKGICTEASYPYSPVSSKTCKEDKCTFGASFSAYVNVTSGSEAELMDALANKGPVSVAIDASHSSFQFYRSGVYNEKKCKNGPDDLDHGVLAVGYGTESGSDYFIVKNSWASSWGLKGYILMSRNKDNQCGIATVASYPVA